MTLGKQALDGIALSSAAREHPGSSGRVIVTEQVLRVAVRPGGPAQGAFCREPLGDRVGKEGTCVPILGLLGKGASWVWGGRTGDLRPALAPGWTSQGKDHRADTRALGLGGKEVTACTCSCPGGGGARLWAALPVVSEE